MQAPSNADFSHHQQVLAVFRIYHHLKKCPPPNNKRPGDPHGSQINAQELRRLIESTSQGTEHKSALEQTRMWRARPRISLEIWTV